MSDSDKAPKPHESIADYLQRLRMSLGLSQKDVAAKARIHVQSLGKIERGLTQTLHHKTLQGLAYALQVPIEYLEALQQRLAVELSSTLRVCPKCWTPGTPPEDLWRHERARFCFECGSPLQDSCFNCQEPISSLRHRFCPLCGTPYNASS